MKITRLIIPSMNATYDASSILYCLRADLSNFGSFEIKNDMVSDHRINEDMAPPIERTKRIRASPTSADHSGFVLKQFFQKGHQ